MRMGKEWTKQAFYSNAPIRDEIVLRPTAEKDCAALRLGPRLCVASTESVALESKELGYLLAQCCCNEIAASGAEPIGLSVSLFVPKSMEEAKIERIMEQIRQCADALRVEVIGGNVEKSDAVTRLVASAVIIGSCPESHLVATDGAQLGDDLVLTKWAGMEATYRMVTDYASVSMQHLGTEGYHVCQQLKGELSAIPAGLLAAELGAHAVYHAAKGGVLGAVHALCTASRCGAYLIEQHIPVLEETEQLCHAFSLDALRLSSAGCLLIACENGRNMVRSLQEKEIPAAIIGQVKYADNGLRIQCMDGMIREIAPPGTDEFYRFAEHMAETEVSLNQG